MTMSHAAGMNPDLVEFWTERHLCTLTTLDPEAGLARVITSKNSAKVRHIATGDNRVAICQVDGGRWCTIEGTAVIRAEADAVAEGVRRYAARYRQPRPNPERVVIEVTITRMLTSSRLTGS
jgi:hypothetical protein